MTATLYGIQVDIRNVIEMLSSAFRVGVGSMYVP
jgi:hypothetical protein